MDQELKILGYVRSSIKDKGGPAKMENEPGAVRAVIELDEQYARGTHGLSEGAEIELFTWFHLSDRTALDCHPRGNPANPVQGVFATRSPNRPNPIGLHRTSIVSMLSPTRFEVEPLEAVDGTPIIDIKPKPKGLPSWKTMERDNQ
ncbi:SAM-dependent methyltransferase [Salidesulfovibrio onnuriiensis]|uniref:SAM-dependent methyltransferase n=1 Tax=Salidesulfovibrio onnuriiensis TaxID=2583823 RepID=UPI0011C9224A|nr:SAM-dependent methyltransferase [Salidesulfovibrio onnuriiensis]